jgi:hypothetical protein
MPASEDLLRARWHAVERAGDVERELRATADELAGWREVTAAAVRALDREIARRWETDVARTTLG